MGKLPAEAFDYIETIREQRIFIDVTEQEIKGKKSGIYTSERPNKNAPSRAIHGNRNGREKETATTIVKRDRPRK